MHPLGKSHTATPSAPVVHRPTSPGRTATGLGSSGRFLGGACHTTGGFTGSTMPTVAAGSKYPRRADAAVAMSIAPAVAAKQTRPTLRPQPRSRSGGSMATAAQLTQQSHAAGVTHSSKIPQSSQSAGAASSSAATI